MESSVQPSVFSSERTLLPWSVLVALLLTLAAVAADQIAAPILYSTSPLWASAACLLLIWRRGRIQVATGDGWSHKAFSISVARLAAFLAGHIALVLVIRALSNELRPVAGAISPGGALFAGLKLSVLAPTLLLFPLSAWRRIAAQYAPELVAALVVLFTYFPQRVLVSLWPWYGQILGRFVFFLGRWMVSGLGYVSGFTPTLTGRELDVTILPSCSGINGVELFQFLFALIALLDWNRLRKGRTLIGYFGGLAFILLGNALRITSFVVLGNHGLSGLISRFHVSAGWLFFSLLFLVYLALTYGWMLGKAGASGRSVTSREEAQSHVILEPDGTQTDISKI